MITYASSLWTGTRFDEDVYLLRRGTAIEPRPESDERCKRRPYSYSSILLGWCSTKRLSQRPPTRNDLRPFSTNILAQNLQTIWPAAAISTNFLARRARHHVVMPATMIFQVGPPFACGYQTSESSLWLISAVEGAPKRGFAELSSVGVGLLRASAARSSIWAKRSTWRVTRKWVSIAGRIR